MIRYYNLKQGSEEVQGGLLKVDLEAGIETRSTDYNELPYYDYDGEPLYKNNREI